MTKEQLYRSLLVEVYNHGEGFDLHRRIGAALDVGPNDDMAKQNEPRGNVVQLRTTDLSHVSEAIERLLSAMRRGGMGTLASYMDGFHITVEPAKSDAPLHCDPIGDGPLCPKYPDCQCGRSLNRS